MKTLILAEKPSAARAIAAALGGFTRQQGYLESAEYRLAWAVGHLVELCDAQEYDGRFRRWRMEDLPIIPAPFRLRPVARTAAQFRLVSKLMGQAPRLINACDAGREGELIFGYVCELAGIKRPVQRLWMQSLTPQAIRKAFADLRPGEAYQRLYASAQCRSQGDWLVGINATRAFTAQSGELLSVGRVQTPTLALIVRREAEIAAFVSQPFWQVDATFAPGERYVGRWVGPEGDRLASAEEAAALVARVKGQIGRVASVEVADKEQPPPQLFDLTSLQRLANQRYRLSAAQTLTAAQNLYEAGLITYPRTDSRYLSRDLVATLPGVLRALTPGYSELAAEAEVGRLTALGGRVVNDRKVTDHHAIIPTGHAAGALSGAQARVYDLIARRLLAQCLPLHRYREAEIWTEVGARPLDRFRTRARQTLSAGWKRAEPDWTEGRRRAAADSPDEEAGDWLEGVPVLAAGDRAPVLDVQSRKGETQPPKRYTEARLLAAMETAGKELDDEGLREAMKERGLGTPATRAAIIERLKAVGYIELTGKELTPTAKGRELVAWVERSGAQVLLAPDLTGEWEQRIGQVQAGTYEPGRLLAEMQRLTREIVDGVARLVGAGRGQKAAAAPEAPGESTGLEDAIAELPPVAGPCPRCGRPVVRGSRDWRCLNAACTVRIPRFLCGHVLTEEEVAAICTRQRSPLITTFVSKAGKPFAAYLVLEVDKVGFEFANRGTVKGKSSGRRKPRAGEAAAPAAGRGRAKAAAPAWGDAAPTRRGRAKPTAPAEHAMPGEPTPPTQGRARRSRRAAPPEMGVNQDVVTPAPKTRSRQASTRTRRAAEPDQA